MAAPLDIPSVGESVLERKQPRNFKRLTKSVISNASSSNDIEALLEITEEEDPVLIEGGLKALEKVFVHFIRHTKCLYKNFPSQEAPRDAGTSQDVLPSLREKYEAFIDKLLELTLHEDPSLKTLGLNLLLGLVEAEGKNPLRENADVQGTFPGELFSRIVKFLVTTTKSPGVFRTLASFLSHDDVRYFYMKTLLVILKTKKRGAEDEEFTASVLSALAAISLPSGAQTLDKFIAKAYGTQATAKFASMAHHKKVYSSLWLSFLQLKLPTAQYKKVLQMLPTKVIPHLPDPLWLSDFLTKSYNMGGQISLLALEGLFLLVHKHNLDYPDFYEKLYFLLTPDAYNDKYRPKFFHLLDLFLQSPLLPSYLVAAFIKRLARLALHAPVSAQLCLMELITNLMVRHRSCRVLADNATAVQDLTSDPYDPTERDLSKCRALESSLWEVKSLEQHFHHKIAGRSCLFEEGIKEQEKDVSSLLEVTTASLMEEETKWSSKVKDTPLTYERPLSLFSWDTSVAQLWTMPPEEPMEP